MSSQAQRCLNLPIYEPKRRERCKKGGDNNNQRNEMKKHAFKLQACCNLYTKTDDPCYKEFKMCLLPKTKK